MARLPRPHALKRRPAVIVGSREKLRLRERAEQTIPLSPREQQLLKTKLSFPRMIGWFAAANAAILMFVALEIASHIGTRLAEASTALVMAACSITSIFRLAPARIWAWISILFALICLPWLLAQPQIGHVDLDAPYFVMLLFTLTMLWRLHRWERGLRWPP
jgi:hypothetical protein